eukprot:GFKZ01010643.1.p2 GENE.GFKZ01010643.1~~GFKZ01010643.1.p2  ORF type:complete len:107 (-),score=11.40 GFKZ01010643.1:64-384(-)
MEQSGFMIRAAVDRDRGVIVEGWMGVAGGSLLRTVFSSTVTNGADSVLFQGDAGASYSPGSLWIFTSTVWDSYVQEWRDERKKRRGNKGCRRHMRMMKWERKWILD